MMRDLGQKQAGAMRHPKKQGPPLATVTTPSQSGASRGEADNQSLEQNFRQNPAHTRSSLLPCYRVACIALNVSTVFAACCLPSRFTPFPSCSAETSPVATALHVKAGRALSPNFKIPASAALFPRINFFAAEPPGR